MIEYYNNFTKIRPLKTPTPAPSTHPQHPLKLIHFFHTLRDRHLADLARLRNVFFADVQLVGRDIEEDDARRHAGGRVLVQQLEIVHLACQRLALEDVAVVHVEA